jgi:hypothetical protein
MRGRSFVEEAGSTEASIQRLLGESRELRIGVEEILRANRRRLIRQRLPDFTNSRQESRTSAGTGYRSRKTTESTAWTRWMSWCGGFKIAAVVSSWPGASRA